MTAISISVRGRKAFEWDGDEKEAAKLLRDLSALSAKNRVAPEQVGGSAIVHFHDRGRFVSDDPTAQGGEMAYMTWMALSADVDGVKVFDRVAVSQRIEVDFTVKRRNGKVRIRGNVKGVYSNAAN